MSFGKPLNTTVAGRPLDDPEAESLHEDEMPSHPDLWTDDERSAMVDLLGSDGVEELRAMLGPVEHYVPAVGERPNPHLDPQESGKP